jgi:hypothetical protein
MKKLVLWFIVLAAGSVYAQKEGQDFCKGDVTGAYFPLDVKKKKLFWGDTFYFETFDKDTVVDGNKYLKFIQVWENGDSDVLLFREKKGAVVQYYPGKNKEMVRFDPLFKEGHVWKNPVQDATYTIVGYNEKITTPFCRYEGLLAIKAAYPKVTYVFYYLKGYGYVAAERDGKIISAVSPDWKE